MMNKTIWNQDWY